MEKKTAARLQEHAINELPVLHNWSALYPNGRSDGAVLLLRSSISPHHGTGPFERVRPGATMVDIPLGREQIDDLLRVLKEAQEILS